jgi:hypothetical protein
MGRLLERFFAGLKRARAGLRRLAGREISFVAGVGR